MKLRISRGNKIGFGVLAALAVGALAVGAVGYHLELRAPEGPGAADRPFTITAGTRTPDVARHLQQAGLIRSKDAFITYLGLHGLRGSIKAGEFELSPSDPAARIAQLITGGGASARAVTVPPGDTLAKIEASAAAKGISRADFAAALNAPHPQAVLATKPAGVSLEGYLYPDTYDVGPQTTARQLVDTMINTLQARLTPDIIQKWQSEGLTIHQGLTLASIVEKEVDTPADRPIVAQIFLSRLKQNIALGSDVTAFYASALAGVSPNVAIDSPYNTRVHTGLPPGPICSPGLDAMQAVADPANTDYLYFLAGKDGKIYYAHTYAEHQRNIQLHL